MADLSPLAWWRRFLALPNDSRTKTLGVAFLVALVAAITVSVTSVTLKPRQDAHAAAARAENLARMVAELPMLEDILRETGAETLETVVVDLERGTIDPGTNPIDFDYVAAQTDPAQSTQLATDDDLAGIGRRPNLAPVYLMRGEDGLALVVLPVYGVGYQSMIRAYLALRGDLNTIAALSIYDQGETPGLGSRITDPDWLARWSGKEATNAAGGEITITVVRGTAAGASEVDGISGATRSATGVSNLVRFWLGPNGFGPFLSRLKTEGS